MIARLAMLLATMAPFHAGFAITLSLMTKPGAGPASDGWKAGGYIDKLPKDPWGNPYQYLSPGIKGEIDVFSYGADGQPGGAGNDADIGSWEL